MARELHKRKNQKLYAIYSTIVDDYITEFLPKEEIEKIWLEDLIEEAKEKAKKYMKEIDKEVGE